MADQQVALNDLQEYDAEESAANYDDYATVELSRSPTKFRLVR